MSSQNHFITRYNLRYQSDEMEVFLEIVDTIKLEEENNNS